MGSLIRYLFRRRRLEADFAEELEFHRVMKQEELENQGINTDAARLASLHALGSVALAQDRARDLWRPPWLQGVAQDVRFGLRVLAKDRWFTVTACFALAMGIAATSTVFTVVNAVLLRNAPVADPDRLISMSMRDTRSRQLGMCYPDFDDWRQAAKTFSAMTLMLRVSFSVSDEGHPPEQHFGPFTSANLFTVIGQQPILGRDFTAGDDLPGAPPVVILSHGLWMSRYGGASSVISRSITVNGLRPTVIGVMGPGMKFPPNSDLWMPLGQTNTGRIEGRRIRSFQLIGRLADGVTLGQARGEISAIAARLARDYPETNKDLVPELTTYAEGSNGPLVKTMYWSLMGAAAFLLLIACSNVANLLLARASSRMREISVRASLGATRWRIVRQLLVESLLLASLAGTASFPLTRIGVRFFDAITRDGGRPYYVEYTIDGAVFAFFAVICLLTGVAFGLAPALHMAGADLQEGLKDGGRSGGSGPRARRWTAALNVAQLGLTLMLLSGAGLLLRSFLNMSSIELGFDTSHLMAMQLAMPGGKYRTSDERLAFLKRVDDRLAHVGALDSATTSHVPLGGGLTVQLALDGRIPDPGERPPLVTMVSVGTRYFEVLGIRLISGRPLVEYDGLIGQENVVINQRLATIYFGGQNPLGRRIRLSQDASLLTPTGIPSTWLTIVAVAPNVRQRHIRESDVDAVVYVPRQATGQGNRATLLVHTRTDPEKTTAFLREEVRALDSDMPLFNVRTMDEELAQHRWSLVVAGSTFAAFAGMALTLAAIGLYALTAFSVSQRTQEIGVRMALGAGPRQIIWLILHRILLHMAIGAAVGVVGAAVVGRSLQSLLVQTSAIDPLMLAAVLGILVLASITACARPLRRAIRLDPTTALRRE